MTKNAGIHRKFRELTEKALSEEDTDRFIGYLISREPVIDDLKKEGLFQEVEEVKEDLDKETRIHEKLEDEFKKLMSEMEELSRNKKAAKTYSPQFPFPAMPFFFEKKA